MKVSIETEFLFSIVPKSKAQFSKREFAIRFFMFFVFFCLLFKINAHTEAQSSINDNNNFMCVDYVTLLKLFF